MKTVVLEQVQDEALRIYLQAFADFDVDRMVSQLHPAFHYERMFNGKIELVINGPENFREFLNSRKAHLVSHSLQVLERKVEKDRVELRFQILSNESQLSNHLLDCKAVFWLLEKKIFHLVVELVTD